MFCSVRETERLLAPNRGARLGNFGVTPVSRDQTWVTVAEWMQHIGCEHYGSDGSVFVARILWDRPNHCVLQWSNSISLPTHRQLLLRHHRANNSV
jgi:hypothetical protein